MKKAIVIGATSGIGWALAKVLAGQGYAVGLAGRRVELLEKLQGEIASASFIQRLDVSEADQAVRSLRALIDDMGGMDLIVLNSGVRLENPDLEWEKSKAMIDVNVTGFVALATAAAHYFEAQGAGHIVGVSSVAGLRGRRTAPAYNASKAFVMNYMQGLRHRFAKLGMPITVTDIRPGLVDTAMVAHRRLFWASTPEEAARQIYAAIKRKRSCVYVTKRWRLIAWIIQALPARIYHRA